MENCYGGNQEKEGEVIRAMEETKTEEYKMPVKGEM
jgi:hypothetical protein